MDCYRAFSRSVFLVENVHEGIDPHALFNLSQPVIGHGYHDAIESDWDYEKDIAEKNDNFFLRKDKPENNGG